MQTHTTTRTALTDCTHRLHSQTQTHTWGLADWPTLKPETQICWLTFLRDSGNETTSITLCPGHQCFNDFTSCQLGLSQPAPFVIATLIWVTQARDAVQHQKSGAYHLQFTNTPESPEKMQASQWSQRETDKFPIPCTGQQIASIWRISRLFSCSKGTIHKKTGLVANRISILIVYMKSRPPHSVFNSLLSFFPFFSGSLCL